MPDEDYVSDDEELFRRVLSKNEFPLKISSSLFNDRGLKPSVDRAQLVASAEASKQNRSDGILSLLTADVRAITGIVNTAAEPGQPTQYTVDVKARPVVEDLGNGIAENLAHAQIEVDPGFETTNRFAKLKEALARLAENRGWKIEPSEVG